MSTLLQIKRSTANVAPNSLIAGELAYSYVSNVIFIGDTATGVMNIGGQYYTELIDQGTAANSASTFVRREANGSAQFSQLDILVAPTANSHVVTKEYVDNAIIENISLDDLSDVSIPGVAADQDNRILIGHANGEFISTDVTGNVTLSNAGVFTIGTAQVINSMLENSSVSITAGAGLVGGGTVDFGNTITIDVNAGDGISNSVSDTVSVDDTVVRTDRNQTLNGFMTFSNTVYIDADLDVTGNLYLSGNTTYINVSTYTVDDPLIYLAANNELSDLVDIGFMGGHNTAGTYQHSGLIRHAVDGNWYLFTGLAEEGHENNVVDIANTTYALLKANLDAQSANVNELTVDNTLLVTGTATVTGDLTVSGGDIIATTTTMNVVNTTATTVNFAGDATTLNFGAAGSTTTVAGDLSVAGGDLTGPATFNLLNVNTNVINLGGAANTVNIGNGLGSVTVKSNLFASQNVTVTNNLIVGENSEANTFISNKTALATPNLTHFNGERLRLYDFDEIGHPNYAIGVEQNHIWMGVDSSANNQGFKWYGNTSLAMRLSGNGVLEVANTIITEKISANILTLSTPLSTSSGGTGLSAFTANGVWYSDTTSTLSFATGTNGQVLQISSGVPTFAMLDGGSF